MGLPSGLVNLALGVTIANGIDNSLSDVRHIDGRLDCVLAVPIQWHVLSIDARG